ncbi:MAG: DUF1330 domain-containing protein [Halioglobus sp.]
MRIVPIVAATLSLFTVVLPATAEHHEAASASESMTYIDASTSALEAMLKLPMDEPIHRLNMIRFKEKAEYEKGSEFAAKGWTGAQAYAEYRRHAGPIAGRLGSKSLYGGMSQLTVIGPEGQQWDSIFILSYPNVLALKGLSEDPEYRKHAFHRTAGVADSRLIRMAPSAE